MLSHLNDGRISVGIGDELILRYYLKKTPQLKIRIVRTYKGQSSTEMCIAVRHADSELLKKIDTSISKLRSDGTIDKLMAKWDVGR